MAQDDKSALPHVAVCEASKSETRMFQEVLKEGGYPMSLIRRPENILAHLLRYKADILLLNCPFGDMDKYAVMQAIRQHPRLHDIVIILLDPEEDVTDAAIGMAWRAGVDTYLKKPVPKEEFTAWIVIQTLALRGKPTDHLLFDA